MSLINQMLQDLEKRRASGAERGALPDQVRVLPREELRGMPWWPIGIAVAVVVIALLAWQFNARAPSGSSELATRTQTDKQLPATSLMPGSPASRLALDLERAPSAAARTPARSGAVVSDTAPQRNLAHAPLTTTTVVAPEPAVTPKSAPAVAESAKSATETSKPASIAPVAATAAPAKSAITASRTIEVLPETKEQAAMGNLQIDKRSQTLTPQQLAENEYREAVNFLNQGRLADAQEGFRRALERNPAHVGARQGLFGLLLDARKNAEAEQLLQDGLKLNPNQPGFAMALASLQYERSDIAGAIETMQRSAPAAQSSPDYLARLAGLLQRQSRHKEAIDSYQAALRLAPGSGVWQMGLGISLQALNRNGEAQEAFRRARNSNTLNPELQAFVDQRLKQLQ
jgi:MSHA biogenesis protein MshN